MGSLLGGESKQSASSKSTSATTVTLPSYLQGPIQDMIDRANSLASKPFTPYTDARVAGLSNDEQAAFEYIRGLSDNPLDLQNSINTTGEVMNRGLYGYDQDTIDAFMNPYVQNVMDISKSRQLDQFDLAKRDLASQQANTGAFGGSRSALAQGQLYDNFARNLSESETQQLYQGYNDAMSRAFQGTQLAGQASTDLANLQNMERQGLYQNAASLQGIGGIQRGINQADLDAKYGEFLREQAYPWEQLNASSNVLLNAGNLLRGSNSTSSSTTTQTSGGGSSGLLGAALGLGSMAMGIPGVGSSVLGGAGSLFGGGFASGLGNMLGIQSSISGGAFGYGQSPGGSAGMINWMQPRYNKGGAVKPNCYAEGGLVSSLEKFAKYISATQEENGVRNQEGLASLQHLLPPEERIMGFPTRKPQSQTVLDMLVDKEQVGMGQPLTEDSIPFKESDAIAYMKFLQNSDDQASKNLLEQLSVIVPTERVAKYNKGGSTNQSPLMMDFGTLLSYLNNLSTTTTKTGATRGEYAMNALSNLPAHLVAASKAPYNKGMALINEAADYINSPWYGDQESISPGIENTADSIPKMKALYEAQQRLLANNGLSAATRAKAQPPQQETPKRTLEDVLAGLTRGGYKTAQDVVPVQAPPVKQEVKEPVYNEMQKKAMAFKNKEDGWNMPLIAFGAALLGGEEGFFKALGTGAQAFVTTKQAQEERDNAKLAEQAKYLLEQRKVAADEMKARGYLQQTLNSYDPEQQQLKKDLIRATIQAKLNPKSGSNSSGSLVQKYFNSIMSSGIAQDPHQARKMAEEFAAGGVDDADTESLLADSPDLTDPDTIAAGLLDGSLTEEQFSALDDPVKAHAIARARRAKELGYE